MFLQKGYPPLTWSNPAEKAAPDHEIQGGEAVANNVLMQLNTIHHLLSRTSKLKITGNSSNSMPQISSSLESSMILEPVSYHSKGATPFPRPIISYFCNPFLQFLRVFFWV